MSEREFTNERFSVMKQLIYFLTTVSVFTSCMGNDDTFRQREWFKQFENKPLTIKEKVYIKQLEKKGYFKVDIQPPTIGVDAYGMSSYSITLCFKFANNNFDSIKNKHYEIAEELIKDVIEDSLIYDMGSISVTLILKDKLNNNVTKKFLYDSFYKKQLEKDLGFKVIKVKGGKYKRVVI